VLEAMGAASLLGFVPGEASPFVVVASGGGSRRAVASAAIPPAVAMRRVGTAAVYPDPGFLHADDPVVEALKTALLSHTYVVDEGAYEIAPGLRAISTQAWFARAFPGTDDLDDALVLGGLSSPVGRRAGRPRLATLDLRVFDGLRSILAHGDDWIAGTDEDFVWHRWAIDWSPTASPAAWAYGR
jgi:hypothetical protein